MLNLKKNGIENIKLKRAVAEKDADIKTLENMKTVKDAAIRSLEQNSLGKSIHISTLKNEVKNKDSLIEMVSRDAKAKDSVILNFQRDVKYKDSVIKNKTEELDKSIDAIHKLQVYIETHLFTNMVFKGCENPKKILKPTYMKVTHMKI